MAFTDAKHRFSNRVADYVRYRPSYPPALLDLLRAECGLTRDSVVADIGSGTGLLTKLFLDNGNRVFGVEPNADMRAAGEEFLSEYKTFTSVNGSAEATTLPDASVDFVTAGQAFHWFDPAATRREFARILRPGGWVVVVWQDRSMNVDPFAEAYEALLQRHGKDYKSVRAAYPERDTIREFFASDEFGLHDVPNHQVFDWEGITGRLRSSSYAPVEGDAGFAPMMAELKEHFEVHSKNGTVRMEYSVHVYFGKLERASR